MAALERKGSIRHVGTGVASGSRSVRLLWCPISLFLADASGSALTL